jgi:1,4-alpha-glucan branching enzyme
LRGEGFSPIHAHDQNRVLAFQRWVPGVGEDIVVVASFANRTWFGYQMGFPRGGRWLEVFNSEAYDTYAPQGNGGEVQANGGPMHGLGASAFLTIPANSLLVFRAG